MTALENFYIHIDGGNRVEELHKKLNLHIELLEYPKEDIKEALDRVGIKSTSIPANKNKEIVVMAFAYCSNPVSIVHLLPDCLYELKLMGIYKTNQGIFIQGCFPGDAKYKEAGIPKFKKALDDFLKSVCNDSDVIAATKRLNNYEGWEFRKSTYTECRCVFEYNGSESLIEVAVRESGREKRNNPHGIDTLRLGGYCNFNPPDRYDERDLIGKDIGSNAMFLEKLLLGYQDQPGLLRAQITYLVLKGDFEGIKTLYYAARHYKTTYDDPALITEADLKRIKTVNNAIECCEEELRYLQNNIKKILAMKNDFKEDAQEISSLVSKADNNFEAVDFADLLNIPTAFVGIADTCVS